MNYSDMVEINVEVEALNLDGIKQNLLDYVQKEVKISIEESVEQAGKSAKDAEDAASVAEDAATSAADCARQASESLGLYYTKEQSDTLLSSKQDTITGAATTITDNNLTANRSLTSNSNGKVDVATTTTTELNYVHGVTSAIQTQLNAKASTALDNLSSGGQMIIDSANGTISNCILEIPQNLKLTLENNVLTLKAGSVLVKPASVYTTVTVANDVSSTISGAAQDGLYVQFAKATSLGALQGIISLNKIFSGTEFPTGNLTDFTIFFNSNEYKFYFYRTNTSSWTEWDLAYPLCLIEIKSGVASFAKDRKGNDMIFNGAGFIGHHAFTNIQVKELASDGYNDDGSLKNIEITTNAFIITEMLANPFNALLLGNGSVTRRKYLGKFKTYNDVPRPIASLDLAYISNDNVLARYDGTKWVKENGYAVFVEYSYNGTTVTDFTIRQPYEGARYLLTDDLYKQIGDVETLLAAI